MTIPTATLRAAVASQPYPVLFATVSGAHLYGFPSPDSDYDLRGVYVLPLREVAGLEGGPETAAVSAVVAGLALDLVMHDAGKFFRLLLRKNGYVLEQLTSPLVVYSTPFHEQFEDAAQGCITRRHAHHYLGFARAQWRLFEGSTPGRVKPLLYVYRALLTGIHLMQTGEVEANLLHLNKAFGLPYLPDLIACKLAGPEQAGLADADVDFHRREHLRLCAELEAASASSRLPDAPTCLAALNDLLLAVRGVA